MATKQRRNYFDPGAGGWTPAIVASVGALFQAHVAYLMAADGSTAERKAKRDRAAILKELGPDGRRVAGLAFASIGGLNGRCLPD